jgi:hypothetical protein
MVTRLKSCQPDHESGVKLNDPRQARERCIRNYGQRCWLRQLAPYATREQKDRLLRVIGNGRLCQNGCYHL